MLQQQLLNYMYMYSYMYCTAQVCKYCRGLQILPRFASTIPVCIFGCARREAFSTTCADSTWPWPEPNTSWYWSATDRYSISTRPCRSCSECFSRRKYPLPLTHAAEVSCSWVTGYCFHYYVSLYLLVSQVFTSRISIGWPIFAKYCHRCKVMRYM